MGAVTVINAAKQDTKYFLVLGDPVLVSGFIVICGGWLFSGLRHGYKDAPKSDKKWGVLDQAIIWLAWLAGSTRVGATQTPMRPRVFGLSMRQTK